MSTTTDYKILSQQEPREVDIENDFSSSLSSDESHDSLDRVLINIGSKQRKRRKLKRKGRNIRMRLDGFDNATESYEVLIGSAKRRRQFLILGGLCIFAILVIGAIVLAVVLVNRKSEDEKQQNELNLEDIIDGALQPKRFDGTWVDDSHYHYTDSSGAFILYDVVKKEPKVIMNSSSPLFTQFTTGMNYEFSSDQNYILMQTQLAKIFRHSYLAEWKIFDVLNNRILNVTVGSANDPPLYRLVKFAPSGHGLIVVHRNNIYYKENPEATEIQVTSDGAEGLNGSIMNGIPDWVYEEEIFSSNSASWFSPDGKKLAFIQFDDTHVPSISIPIYGFPGQFQYPQTIDVNYPKSGAPNPIVKFFTVDFEGITQQNVNQKVQNIPVPAELATEEHLITSVAWANDNTLISVWMNRVQNKAIINKCVMGGSCSNAQTLESTDGWVEFYTAPFFNKDGSEMFFIGPNEDYRHIKVLNLNSNTLSSRTSGKFIVTEILKYNKDQDVIIYTANLPDDIKAQHVYAIRNQNGASAVCLSCNLHEGYSYYGAEVSEGGNHIVITANGPSVPRVDLYEIKIDGTSISLTNHVEIENNNALKSTLEGKKMPTKVYEVVKLDADTDAYVVMIQPPNLDENQKYPILVDVYGGPDSSSVTNRWSVEWGTYLASALGIIYARIDGRGSGLRSDTHLHKLYKSLGTVEVEDQIRTVEELIKKHSYIDAERVGIWGWSYGGYVSGMSLMSDNDVFKCATSVAPVTDWTLYDTIYTERYMVLPKDNLNSYNVSRLTNYIGNIEKYDKKYMLVHGTMDDNVHFQQGMVLARALERADIEFREITYPDEDHALAHVRPHLYHSLERFFRECFKMSQ